jgi:TP901 family phage tail tape measure protein
MKKFGSVALRSAKIATGVFTGIGVAAVKAATTIDGAQRKIQVGTGATGKALQRLEGDFRVVFAGVPDSAGSVADAMTSLTTILGSTGKELQGLTENVLDVSRLTGTDAANNSLAFARAMKGWQKPATDGRLVLDKLFRTTQLSGIGFSDLLNTINEYSVVLRNADLSMEQSLDLFGRLSTVGISVSRIMPGLNAAFRNWAAENKNIQQELKRTIDEIKNSETRVKAIDIATKAFGAEGAQRLADSVRNGTFALEGLGDALGDADGSIQKSKDLTFSLGEEFGKLRNKLVLAIEPIGRAFIELFKQTQPGIASFIENMGEKMPGAVVAAIRGIGSLIMTMGTPMIKIFNEAQIKAKQLAIVFLDVGKTILGVLARLPKFIIGEEAAEGFKRNIQAAEVAIKGLEQSIVKDRQEIEGAAAKTQEWANVVDGFATRLDGVLQAQKKAREEAANATEQVKKTNTETDKLKTSTTQFAGTVTVAGQKIGVELNGNLKNTLELVRKIRVEAQAAAAAGGVA